MLPRRRHQAGGAPSDEGGRVALILAGDADRELVASELRDEHEVLVASRGVPGAAFDVAVVDEHGLRVHGEALDDRTAASETFLPVLCLVPRGTDPPPSLWERVDDVATRPLSRHELRARVASLLRARDLSVALRRRSERLERVGSVLAHDLRNPLSVASGYVDRAVETGDVDDLAPAVDALDRVDRLVDDVLSLARHGTESLDVTTVDLAAVARSAWASVDTGTATLDLSDDLGTVDADESRLRELFENLFRNCVEHGSTSDRPQADGPAVRVTVDRLPDGGFAVSDDGPGIPETDRDRVFAHGYTTRTDGTGFGLAIVERIATLHGWTVTVGDADPGARFEFD